MSEKKVNKNYLTIRVALTALFQRLSFIFRFSGFIFGLNSVYPSFSDFSLLDPSKNPLLNLQRKLLRSQSYLLQELSSRSNRKSLPLLVILYQID